MRYSMLVNSADGTVFHTFGTYDVADDQAALIWAGKMLRTGPSLPPEARVGLTGPNGDVDTTDSTVAEFEPKK